MRTVDVASFPFAEVRHIELNVSVAMLAGAGDELWLSWHSASIQHPNAYLIQAVSPAMLQVPKVASVASMANLISALRVAEFHHAAHFLQLWRDRLPVGFLVREPFARLALLAGNEVNVAVALSPVDTEAGLHSAVDFHLPRP